MTHLMTDSLMVEPAAHNSLGVGSTPARSSVGADFWCWAPELNVTPIQARHIRALDYRRAAKEFFMSVTDEERYEWAAYKIEMFITERRDGKIIEHHIWFEMNYTPVYKISLKAPKRRVR